MWSVLVYPAEGYYVTHWLTGLWSTEAKVEGMLKATWHWGSYSSVANDPLGVPGRTPLYVGLPSAWGSVEMEHLSPWGPCWGTWRVLHLPGTLMER